MKSMHACSPWSVAMILMSVILLQAAVGEMCLTWASPAGRSTLVCGSHHCTGEEWSCSVLHDGIFCFALSL